MFVANFEVQLDNFWTAGRYFNKLYFINVCVKVCLILVFSFCRLNICCLILSLAQTQNLKLISFFCRSPVSGNRTLNGGYVMYGDIYYTVVYISYTLFLLEVLDLLDMLILLEMLF